MVESNNKLRAKLKAPGFLSLYFENRQTYYGLAEQIL
jgi:hypothetical protein